MFSLVVECVLLVETLVSHTSLSLSLDGLYCFTFQHMQKCLWALQYLCKTNQIEIDVNLKKVLWTWVSNSPSLHIIFDLWKKFCNGKNVRFFESAFDKTHFGEKMPIKYVCKLIWSFFYEKALWSCFPNAFNTYLSRYSNFKCLLSFALQWTSHYFFNESQLANQDQKINNI